MERHFMMKRRKSNTWPLAVAATVLILGTLLSGGTALASQKTISELPVTIAPIKTPFEMPQLKRPSFPDITFDIRDYGAVQCMWEDDEKHKSTKAIHKAIVACHEGGGGKVVIPRGNWLTGAIRLRSNVNLHVAEGAVVHFSNDLEDYLPVVHVRCEGVEAYNYSPLIYAPHVENIAITGSGTLHGHGRWWWPWAKNNDRGNRVEATKVPLEERSYGKGAGREGMRPTFIVPWKAKNILIEGITLVESPMWNVHPVYSENIIVRGITVHSLESPNGDGIVPDSCKNVLIEYNHLETGDDAVVIKSGLNEDGLKIGIASENIVVRNFTARDVRTGSGGIVFGSETSGGIRNIYVHDAYFDGCDRGIRFKTTRGRGNVIENIFIKNVEMKNIERQAINFNSYYERGATGKSPLFRNVYINNVRVNGAHTAIEMIGLPEKWLENINVKNAVFENVGNGAIANRVKELTLENVSIKSNGRPIELDDVFEATIKNVKLSGRRPPLLVGGSESGAITIEGLNPDHVECAKNVPRGAVSIGGAKRP
jgi:polygalacturonase